MEIVNRKFGLTSHDDGNPLAGSDPLAIRGHNDVAIGRARSRRCRRNPATSPVPLRRVSNSPDNMDGRKRVRPVLTRMSDFRANVGKRERLRLSAAERIDHRTGKQLNVTMVETGLPGNPKKYLHANAAKDDGLARLNQCAGEIEFRGQSSVKTCSTRSYFPMETPPARSSRSERKPFFNELAQAHRFIRSDRQAARARRLRL